LRTERGLQLRKEADEVTRKHWNAQRVLDPLPVVIPFADKLSFPSSWMRTRRDHARFLNLIEVSAFLHQHQRERVGSAIVAAVDDYAVAYGLAAEVLTETLSDLKRPLKEAYEHVRGLVERNEGGVTRREIREAMQMPDSTVRNWLSELVSLEYLEAEGGGVGKTTRYRLTGRGPKGEVVLGLLSPDELRKLLR
jgi:DNA-binding transcriptional ArsR family regulator